MEEKFEEKVFEYKLKSLIEQRTLISQMLTVLTGGVVWLCFLDVPDYKYIVAAFGFYFICMLIKSLMNTIEELDTCLYGKNRGSRHGKY